MPTVAAICTGNTCRSPMAEGFLKQLFDDCREVNIISAGTAAFPGQPATAEAIRTMGYYNIDISEHVSQGINEKLIVNTDLLIAMTQGHARELKAFFPEHRSKILTIGELARKDFQLNISDPIGTSLENYRQTAGEIKKLLTEAKHEIVNLLQLR